MSPFEEFLKKLGELLNLPLTLDEHLACVVNIDETLDVQLEYDETKDCILVASYISETPPGKYRENILEGALLENISNPMFGIFSYLSYSNQLVMHKFLSFSKHNALEFSGFLTEFIDKALLWQKAIRASNPPPISSIGSKKHLKLNR